MSTIVNQVNESDLDFLDQDINEVKSKSKSSNYLPTIWLSSNSDGSPKTYKLRFYIERPQNGRAYYHKLANLHRITYNNDKGDDVKIMVQHNPEIKSIIDDAVSRGLPNNKSYAFISRDYYFSLVKSYNDDEEDTYGVLCLDSKQSLKICEYIETLTREQKISFFSPSVRYYALQIKVKDYKVIDVALTPQTYDMGEFKVDEGVEFESLAKYVEQKVATSAQINGFRKYISKMITLTSNVVDPLPARTTTTNRTESSDDRSCLLSNKGYNYGRYPAQDADLAESCASCPHNLDCMMKSGVI